MIHPVLAFGLNHISWQGAVVIVAVCAVLMAVSFGIFSTSRAAVARNPFSMLERDGDADAARHQEAMDALGALAEAVAELRARAAEIERVLKEVD